MEKGTLGRSFSLQSLCKAPIYPLEGTRSGVLSLIQYCSRRVEEVARPTLTDKASFELSILLRKAFKSF